MGTAPAGTCPIVTAGIRVSGPAAGPSGEAKHRINIMTIHWLYTHDLKILSLTGRLTMVKKGLAFRPLKRCRAFCR
jgi:hypothetical protein